jgi:hypothetical protein
MRYLILVVSMFAAAGTVGAISFQAAYDAAPPGEGYDKLLVLEPNEKYTGGCGLLPGKKSCIRGNGAVCDLKGGPITAWGAGTELYITGCCLINGGDAAITVQDTSRATIDGNTICKGYAGVRSWNTATAVIKNNIIYGQSYYGIARLEKVAHTVISYNDVDENAHGNYMEYCPG